MQGQVQYYRIVCSLYSADCILCIRQAGGVALGTTLNVRRPERLDQRICYPALPMQNSKWQQLLGLPEQIDLASYPDYTVNDRATQAHAL